MCHFRRAGETGGGALSRLGSACWKGNNDKTKHALLCHHARPRRTAAPTLDGYHLVLWCVSRLKPMSRALFISLFPRPPTPSLCRYLPLLLATSCIQQFISYYPYACLFSSSSLSVIFASFVPWYYVSFHSCVVFTIILAYFLVWFVSLCFSTRYVGISLQ